jgi:hypothetical protein
MRRLAAVTLVAVLGLVGTACDPELSRKTSGTFTGSAPWQFGNGCGFVHQSYEASYVRRQGAEGGQFDIEGCVGFESPYPGAFTFVGTFVLTTQGGAVLRGPARGTTDAVGGTSRFTLTVEQGTKRFLGATGVILVEGVWDGGNPGTFNGTLNAFLEGPSRERLTL